MCAPHVSRPRYPLVCLLVDCHLVLPAAGVGLRGALASAARVKRASWVRAAVGVEVVRVAPTSRSRTLSTH